MLNAITTTGKQGELYPRSVNEEDIGEICTFPQTREELFYCFPKASFPLSEAQLRTVIAQRADSTVIEQQGRAVAFANFCRWQRGGQCVIGNVMVAPAARNGGIGRTLIRHMLWRAVVRHGAREVCVSCFHPNVAGLLLYSRLGFRPYNVEERIDYHGERVALIHFTVKLEDRLAG